MGLLDFLFGGTDTSGQEAQIAANALTAERIFQQGEKARQDVLSIFPQAQQAQQAGFQGAADIFGQVIPQQAGVFQQGSVGAQNILQQGLAGINNAILGLPQDLSPGAAFAAPTPFNVDFGFAQQQLPQTATAGQSISGELAPSLFTPNIFEGIPQDVLDQILNIGVTPVATVSGAPPPPPVPISPPTPMETDTEEIPAIDLQTSLTQVLDTITVPLDDPNRSALQAEAVRKFAAENNITNEAIAQAFGVDISVVNEFLA